MAGRIGAVWSIVCVCAAASPLVAQLAARSAEAVPALATADRQVQQSTADFDDAVLFGPPVSLPQAEEHADEETEPLIEAKPLSEPVPPEVATLQADLVTDEPVESPVEVAPSEKPVKEAAGTPLGLPADPKPLPAADSVSPVGVGSWMSRVAAPLIGVLSLAVGAAWLFKKAAGAQGGLAGAIGPGGRAPSGVLEVLGRYPVARGCTLVLLKLDRRVLLLSQSSGGRGGAASFSTLAELESPEDVASILMKTRAADGEAIESGFLSALKGFHSEPPESFVEVREHSTEVSPTDRALARIRARAASLGFAQSTEDAR